MNEGQLYLGGRLVVRRIMSRIEAVKLYKNDELMDAQEWIDGMKHSGTPLHLQRRLSSKLTKRLRFVTKSGSAKQPFFVTGTRLDNQATRGVRELTADSAALLDRIIDQTDQLPRTGKLVTVTESMLRQARTLTGAPVGAEREFLPDYRAPIAVDLEPPLPGRAATTVNRVLRDTDLARRVKLLHGYKCQICGHRIELPNGTLYAEAHHIQPLGKDHNGHDVIGNILCVCPNHHAELDFGARPLKTSELAIADGHKVERRYVDYHNKNVYHPWI